MRKSRKAMLPQTKLPQTTKPGGGQAFRVHHKGVSGGEHDPIVPLKMARSPSLGGGKPKAPKMGATRARKPATSKMSDKALLKGMPFNG